MNDPRGMRLWRTGLLALGLWGAVAAGAAWSEEGPDLATVGQARQKDDTLPAPKRAERDRKAGKSLPVDRKTEEEIEAKLPKLPPSILPAEMNGVDLACVLRLANVENPDINIARAQVGVADAQRMTALAMIFPNLNAGMNYDTHTGPLQQSSGNILQVNRGAFYLGGGAGATAAGTVPIPMVQYIVNASDGMFHYLAIRQQVAARRFDSLAVRNQMLLRVAVAYLNLLRAEGRRAIALQNRRESHEIARLTGAYARTGLGKQSDADRAAAELARRNNDVVQAEQEALVASADLAHLLNLPPSLQLHVVDGWTAPTQLVPDPTPLHDLLGIALLQRPELAARKALIREAVLLMRNEVFLPLSPTVLAGYSAGTYGGGSNLIAQPGGFQGFAESRFGSFGARDDLDVVLFWTAQNFGVGNWARYRVRKSETRIAELELVRELNRVRNDVAAAYAGTHARWAQIGIAENGVKSGYDSYQEDLTRIKGGQGLPIELLDSFRLAAEARFALLDSVIGYDKAQFALYVALGQPPAKVLAREVPTSLVPQPAPAPPLPACADGRCASGPAAIASAPYLPENRQSSAGATPTGTPPLEGMRRD